MNITEETTQRAAEARAANIDSAVSYLLKQHGFITEADARRNGYFIFVDFERPIRVTSKGWEIEDVVRMARIERSIPTNVRIKIISLEQDKNNGTETDESTDSQAGAKEDL